MKIEFEGSLAEFQALFRGTPSGEFQVSDYSAEPLDSVDPGDLVASSPPLAIVEPDEDESALRTVLGELSPGDRAAGWAKFKEFCAEWVQGLGDEEAAQPNRVEMMTELGQGRWPRPILIMAYECKSLQRLVEAALLESEVLDRADYGDDDAYLDYIDQVAGNMVQVSHIGLPDLAGAFDYSAAWRRTA